LVARLQPGAPAQPVNIRHCTGSAAVPGQRPPCAYTGQRVGAIPLTGFRWDHVPPNQRPRSYEAESSQALERISCAHPVADGFAVAMGRGLDGLYVEVFLEKPAEERVPA